MKKAQRGGGEVGDRDEKMMSGDGELRPISRSWSAILISPCARTQHQRPSTIIGSLLAEEQREPTANILDKQSSAPGKKQTNKQKKPFKPTTHPQHLPQTVRGSW